MRTRAVKALPREAVHRRTLWAAACKVRHGTARGGSDRPTCEHVASIGWTDDGAHATSRTQSVCLDADDPPTVSSLKSCVASLNLHTYKAAVGPHA